MGKRGAFGELRKRLGEAANRGFAKKQWTKGVEEGSGIAHRGKVYILTLEHNVIMLQYGRNLCHSTGDQATESPIQPANFPAWEFRKPEPRKRDAQVTQPWIWTRKVEGKTVTRTLSNHRAQKMKQAIANYREFEAIVHELREITQSLILHTPDPNEATQPRKRPKSSLS